jgi:hypothetical protein
MVASPNTPPSGENVSDEQCENQIRLKEYAVSDLDYCIDTLNQAVSTDTDLREIRHKVKQTRATLEFLETVLDDQLEPTDLEVRLTKKPDWRERQ